MHCNIFFSQFSIDSENPLNRFRQEAAAPRWTPLSPRLQQLEAPHLRPRSRVGGWCAVETLSELRRRAADFWRTTLSETVNSQRSRSHPGNCTARLRVALSSGERGGIQCQRVTPLHLAGRRRDHSYVSVYVRQKCTMQSQKQWHYLSLTMAALLYI